ncbi:hypothetical protein HTY52_13020 [Cupriavidus taiwanensis]|uniref:hypothetical protein n=1 Tax=Cupriavidus taiwanensis TaxID=164546 RepID=UPI001573F237|nr:hypothetical protein [Cupriavidus taiwanensis]NSX14998.1 hypothetical protein [Cupriavidus taiwanensis]
MTKTIEIKGFIHAYRPEYGMSTFSFCTSEDMSQYGYVLIGPHTITFEVPDTFNPVAAEVEALKKQKDKLREEFNAHLARINDRITSLQAIEFSPAEVKA